MIVAPSILAGDFTRFGEEVEHLEQSGADWIHFDIMDGHFVPNLTMGPDVVRALRKRTRLIFDAHLMVEHPERWVERFIEAGADRVVFHQEAARDSAALAEKIRSEGKKAGVAVNPATPIEQIAELLPAVDLVLVMSVNPGFCGQAFMPEVLDKVRWLRARMGAEYLIALDGGVDRDTARAARLAGVNVLVAGTAVMRAACYRTIISELRGESHG